MLTYWLLLGVLAFGSLVFQQRYRQAADGSTEIDRRLRNNVAFWTVLVAITVLIGLRYRVGGDWYVYARWFRAIPVWSFHTALLRSPDEIGYTTLNWLIGRLGAGIWLVNLICAIPFVIGLAVLSREQPNPWLALVVATPLLIIVVGMGYTRQATALGFMLVALVGLSRGRGFWWFLLWTVAGSLFHQSIIVLIPLLPVLLFRFTPVSLLLLVIAALAGYFVLLPDALEHYSHGYINQVYVAKGALFRVAPNSVTALLYLLFKRRFDAPKIEYKIWAGFSYAAILIQILYFFVTSNVSLDRVSVYILPLQVWVWSKVPTSFGAGRRTDLVLTTLVIAYSTAILWLWLAFANHSKYWVPYQIYPFS
jgi:hypothetical protein